MLAVGVPEMVPLPELKDRPVGKAGEISQVAISPPPTEKVIEVIMESRVRVALLTEDVMLGTGSLMMMMMVAESEPP